MKKILMVVAITVLWGCAPDIPGAPDFSSKEKTTVTTNEEIPKIAGKWDGYCHDYYNTKTSDKIARLFFGQRCGESYMSLDQESQKLTFEFGREFFEYYISEEVQSCPANAQNCDCNEYDGKEECTQFSIGSGECTLVVSADVQDTILVESDTLLGSFSNRYLRLTNLQSELVYLSKEVENTDLPREEDVPFDFYSNLEKAKMNCMSFANLWKSKKEPLHLVYQKVGEDAKRLIFPGKESGPLSLSFIDSPMMAFKK